MLTKGLADAGKAVDRVADLKADNALKMAKAAYLKDARTLMSDPNGGFLSLKGDAALSSDLAVKEAYFKLARKHSAHLPNRVRPAFMDYSAAVEAEMAGEFKLHQRNQMLASTRDAHNVKLTAHKEEAIATGGHGLSFLNNLADGISDIKSFGPFVGEMVEETARKVVEFGDDVVSGIVNRLAETNPIAAQTRLESLNEHISEEAKGRLEQTLKPRVTTAKAKNNADTILNTLKAQGVESTPAEHMAHLLARNVVNNASFLDSVTPSEQQTWGQKVEEQARLQHECCNSIRLAAGGCDAVSGKSGHG